MKKHYIFFVCLTSLMLFTFGYSYEDIVEKRLDVESIIGVWHLQNSDTLQVEFKQEKSVLRFYALDRQFLFAIDSLNTISNTAYIPNWPPYYCNLDLIAPDTLAVKFQMFIVKEVEQLYSR